MALVPLTRVTFRMNDGESQHFYFYQERLNRGQEFFLADDCGLPKLRGLEGPGVIGYEFTAPGFYVEADIAQFKEIMAPALVKPVALSEGP